MTEYHRALTAMQSAGTEADLDAAFLGINWTMGHDYMLRLLIEYLSARARVSGNDGR